MTWWQWLLTGLGVSVAVCVWAVLAGRAMALRHGRR
jgi:hypothetical protein